MGNRKTLKNIDGMFALEFGIKNASLNIARDRLGKTALLWL